jgi:pyridoxal phosphate enzyme (YggS family)
MNLIQEKISHILSQIPPQVRLIAVSKTVSPEAIRAAYSAGIRDFAESRLQEALEKQEQLQDLSDICWHFIGHIQTNKAKKTLLYFHWLHSVDSLKLALHLNKLSRELNHAPEILLQVKLLPDPNKYGWSKTELLNDLARLNQCSHLKIRGLMTILPFGLSENEQLKTFQNTQILAQEIQQQKYSNIAMGELSMGMSGDYLLAIQAGATMIRLGTIIFGARY